VRSVSVEWGGGTAERLLAGPHGAAAIIARELLEIDIPRRHAWGASVSVNRVIGPRDTDGDAAELSIEMQSGDLIRIVADRFELPTIESR